MVGRFYSQFAFHEANQNQDKHRKTNCSYPIDELLLVAAHKLGLPYVYCQHKDGTMAMRASVEDLINAPVYLYGNRVRHYLNDTAWEVVPSLKHLPWCEKVYSLEKEILNGV